MRALFCGLGSIGQRHLRNLRALAGDKVEILAYRSQGTSPVINADMTVRRDVTLETAYGIHAVRSLDEGLAARPDMVFVTGPNSTHVPIAMSAARAGCHLFIEKPVSHTTEGLEELLEIVERQRLVAFVGYQFRFHPGLQCLKDVIDRGGLGRIVAAHIVNAEYLPGWHPYEDYRTSHAARADLGGGCLSIQTHELDFALWLFGMPQRVFAVGGHLSSLEVDVEDSVSVLLHCERDGRPLPVHVHLDYLQRPPQRVCEVVGDAGKARYDYYANHVAVHDLATGGLETVTFDNFDRNQMFMDQLRAFLACIRGEAAPIVDLREGIRSLRVSLAAQQSLRTQTAVEVIDG